MDPFSDRLKAIVERARAVHDDPDYQRNQERLRAEWDDHQRMDQERIKRERLEASGIPEGFWDLAERPESTPAIDLARTFLGDPRITFLTLAGTKGRGKTVALCWAVLMHRGRYVVAHDLVRLSTFDGPAWAALEHAPLLAVDELGAEHPNPAFEANLYALLDARYANRRKTILGTNLDSPQFKARYCAGPMDRLYERLRTAGIFEPLKGESMRKHWSEGKRDGD